MTAYCIASFLSSLPTSLPSNFIFLHGQDTWYTKASQTPLRLQSKLICSTVFGKWGLIFLHFFGIETTLLIKIFLRLWIGWMCELLPPFKSLLSIWICFSQVSSLTKRWYIAIKTSNTICCISKEQKPMIWVLKAIYISTVLKTGMWYLATDRHPQQHGDY